MTRCGWQSILKPGKHLTSGPVRTSFRLTYPPFLVRDAMVTETRTISLDAGSQLSRITETYTGIENEFTVAAGIVKRKRAPPSCSLLRRIPLPIALTEVKEE
ncbi:MAG: DUF4861 family protein [Bacteroidales bacterium]